MALTDFTVKNGFIIDNQEDATGSTSGGSFTTFGGAAIAKKLFVGSDVDIGGNLHLAAGTNTLAPITLTSGTNLTTPVAGSIEYDGTKLYFTTSSNSRKTLAYQDDIHYIGTTSVALNRSTANLALTGISSIAFPGSTSGSITLQPISIAGTNTITLPATTGTVVTTGDTGTVTSTMIADGTIVDSDINNSAGIEVTKLSASTISGVTLGNNLYALSVGTGLTYSVGTTYDGSADATISLNQQAINTIIANTTFVVNDIYIGTTQMSVTRTSGNQSFTGISSIGFPGSTSGNITLEATAVAGTHTITLPATTGTVITTGDTGTITSTMIADGTIVNDDLAGSISDSKLSTITTANKVSNSATTATSSNTSSAIVARDSSGDFSAGTITATLIGNASTATTAGKLTSPTTIQGVSFDGSSPINVVTAGTGINVSGTQVSIGQAVSTTSNVTFNNLTVNGNLNVTGTTYTNSSTNTSYADSIIELHYSNDGTLTSDDGKDIGIRMHYYKTSDKNAALLLANDTQAMEFYVDGTESNGVFSGTYGKFKGSQFESTATTGTAPFVVASTTRVTNLNAATAGNADTVTNGVYTTDTGTVTSTMIANDTIVNADINSSAAIAYSKLNLATSIVNADVSTSAAIAYSKLNLATSIVNADVSTSAAIAYSKLNLATSIVNADVSTSAAIDYSKLNLATSIVNADISPSAAIAVSKLAASSISGITLGNNLYSLSAGTGLSFSSGSAFNGSAASTLALADGYGDTKNPYASKTQKYFLAAPNALDGAPVFRAILSSDIPTLNQSTTGSAATLTTARAIYGNNFDGSAALTQIIASTYGGTGNGFTKFTGPTTAERTFTLPDSNATILYSGGALGTPSSGTLTNCTFPTLNQNTTGSSASCTGNSATATKLATARNINGVAFDGSADITVTAAAGTLTGTTLKSTVVSSSLTSVGTLTSLSVTGGNSLISTSTNFTSPGTLDGSQMLQWSNSVNDAGWSFSGVDNRVFTIVLGANNHVALRSNGNLDVIGNLLPYATTTYNLGSATLKWSNVYATTFNGNATSANYADLAENYEADKRYEPGTVVEFGGSFEITEATPNSRRVAGIISTNPAYLMNAEAKGHFILPVGLTGRVPCKVQGTIRKGDMMVSAGNGYARAEEDPKLGSVIGKALEDFNGETGIIEVVVGRI